MPGSSWLMGTLLAFGAIDLIALDAIVGPRALASAKAVEPVAIEPAPPPPVAPAIAASSPAPPIEPRSGSPKPEADDRSPPLRGGRPKPEPPLAADELRPVIVYFATDRAAFDDAAARALDRFATTLAADPRGTVEIVGHADQRGTERHNEELSERRMARVRDYLAAHGVDAARLHGRAAGAREPAQRGAGPAAFAANRRTEIRRKP